MVVGVMDKITAIYAANSKSTSRKRLKLLRLFSVITEVNRFNLKFNSFAARIFQLEFIARISGGYKRWFGSLLPCRTILFNKSDLLVLFEEWDNTFSSGVYDFHRWNYEKWIYPFGNGSSLFLGGDGCWNSLHWFYVRHDNSKHARAVVHFRWKYWRAKWNIERRHGECTIGKSQAQKYSANAQRDLGVSSVIVLNSPLMKKKINFNHFSSAGLLTLWIRLFSWFVSFRYFVLLDRLLSNFLFA